jgi:CIC family chloride channel protein
MKQMNAKKSVKAEEQTTKTHPGHASIFQDKHPTKQTHTQRNNTIQKAIPPSLREIFQPAVPGIGGLESSRFLIKWLVLGSIIGITSGTGAIALSVSINIATNLFLKNIVGYIPPEARGDGFTQITPILHLWWLPVITTLGGLLSGLLVFTFSPDAEGHGTDAVIDAIHRENGEIDAKVPLIKLVASAITIGSGGSSGREGPVAQIGAGLSSLLGKLLHLSPEDRRIAVTIGMGAGIGAIFKAPLGGALLAAEILYLRDIEIEVFIPAIIASTTGYTVYGFFFGFTPIFGNLQIPAIGSPVQFIYYAVLGVCAGLVGICYASSFYGVNKAFRYLKLPRWIKPAIGGLIVGIIGLIFPQALGISYGWVQSFMSAKYLLTIPLWILLCLPFAKIVATGLSIGSGGSGGTHGPGMVIGGFLGAFLWDIMRSLPFMPQQPSAFIVVGMMALFGAVAHTPIAVMVMLAEMTGNLSLLAPAMIALSISITIVGNNTIFRSQLPNRKHSPAHKTDPSPQKTHLQD